MSAVSALMKSKGFKIANQKRNTKVNLRYSTRLKGLYQSSELNKTPLNPLNTFERNWDGDFISELRLDTFHNI